MPKLPDKRALGEPTMRPGGGVVTAKAFGAPYSAAEFGGDGGLGALGAGLKSFGAAIEGANEQAEKDEKFAALARFDEFDTNMEMERQRFIREAPANTTADGIAQSWEDHSRPRYAEFYKSLPVSPKLRREFDYRIQDNENRKKLSVFNEGIRLEDSNARIQFAEQAERLYGEITPDNIDEKRQRLRDFAQTSRLRPGERGPMYRKADLALQQEVLRRAEAESLADPLNAEKRQRYEDLTFAATPKGQKESMARRRFQYDPELDDEPAQPGQDRRVPPEQGGNMPMFPIGGSMQGKTIDDVPSAGERPQSRDFGPGVRLDEQGRAKSHAGLDIPGKIGDPVLAVRPGTVVKVGNDGGGYGPFVDVKYDDGTVHRIGHLGDTDKGGRQTPYGPGIQEGTRVQPGQTLGYVGVGGNAGHDFPHAHYEVFKDEQGYRAKGSQPSVRGLDVRLDPREYFRGGRSTVAGIRPTVTAYSPQAGGDRMEGGYESSVKGPDGANQVRTLQDWKDGKASYVTVAGSKEQEGQRYRIPELTWIDAKGNKHTSRDVPVVVHDTGAAFRGKGDQAFDIPVDRDMPSAGLGKQPFSKQQVQFIPEAGRDVAQRGVMAPKQFAGVAQKGGTVTDVTPVELDPKTGQPIPQQSGNQLPAAASSTLPVSAGDPGFYGQGMVPTSTGMAKVDHRGRLPVWYGEAQGTHEYAGKLDRLPFQFRQASSNRVEAAVAKALNEIENDIKKYDEGALRGVAPPQQEVDRLKALVAKSDDPYLKSRIEELELTAFGMDQFGMLVPEVGEAEIARMEASSRDENGQLRMTDKQRKTITIARGVINENRAAIARNNLEWGHSKRLVKLEALDFANPASIRKRMYASDEMAQRTGKPGLLFMEEEESKFKALVEKGGKPMLTVFAAVTKETGDKAGRYLQQIAKEMPEAPWLGSLVLDAEKAKSHALMKAAEDAARGAELRHQNQKNGIKVPYTLKDGDPTNAVRDIITNEYADAFITDAVTKQGLVQTAQLIYEARASSRGLVTYNEALWKESLHAAAGEHTVNGVKYGGIVHQDRGLFGGNAGRAIPVPVTMNQQKFLEVRDVLTQQDLLLDMYPGGGRRGVRYGQDLPLQDSLSGLSPVPGSVKQKPGDKSPSIATRPEFMDPMNQGYGNEAYSGPVYDTGKPLSIADFRRARLVASGDGDGKYLMALGDLTGNDPQYIKDASGRNYVFDVHQFEDTLRKRRPDLYLDKDKKPVGMMRLGGPGSFSVGEAASPVEKTLFVGEESKTADHGMAAEAREMAKAHKSPREIFHTTGWFQNKNGKWKSEIDDSNAEVFDDESELADFRGTKRLDEFFAHEDLYAALPELKDTPVEFVSQPRDRNAGWMDMGKKALTLNMPVLTKLAEANGIHLNEVIRSVVLHETQHLQQDMGGEGRAAVEEHVQKPYAERSHEKEAYDTQRRVNTPKAARRMIAPEAVIAADEEHVSRLARHTPNIAFDAQGRAVDTQWTTVSDKLDARKKKK